MAGKPVGRLFVLLLIRLRVTEVQHLHLDPLAEELHDDAAMNIAQYPRSHMRCRNVECVLGDATEVGPPEGEAIHYFFNPFSREAFAEVLNNIVVSYRHKPRRLYLILVDPVAIDAIGSRSSGLSTMSANPA